MLSALLLGVPFRFSGVPVACPLRSASGPWAHERYLKPRGVLQIGKKYTFKHVNNLGIILLILRARS